MLTFLGSPSIILLQELERSDFSDLGMKLLGGFVLAVVVAIAFTIIKLRWRDKNPPAAFISISPSRGKDRTPKGGED